MFDRDFVEMCAASYRTLCDTTNDMYNVDKGRVRTDLPHFFGGAGGGCDGWVSGLAAGLPVPSVLVQYRQHRCWIPRPCTRILAD